MANIYSSQELINRKYTTKENFYMAVQNCKSFLSNLEKSVLVTGSLFGAAARGDYKRGSDVDMIIVVQDESYESISQSLNILSMNIREKLNIPLDLHFFRHSDVITGNMYYDPSFISHVVSDCPDNCKFGKPLDEIIVPGWTAPEAVKARMLLAKLDLARLEAGFDYHYRNQDSYFINGIEKLFARTQHTTRNILFINGDIDKYRKNDRSKKAFLDLYLKVFKDSELFNIEKEICDAENRYYNILEKTINRIENGKIDLKEYEEFLGSLKYLIPLANRFYNLNLKLLKELTLQ